MKKLVVSCIGAICLALPGLVLADGSGAGIIGSPHDFTDDYSDEVGGAVLELGSSGGWNKRNEICRVCHVPHDHQLSTWSEIRSKRASRSRVRDISASSIALRSSARSISSSDAVFTLGFCLPLRTS